MVLESTKKRAMDPALMWTAVVAVLIEAAAIHLLVSSHTLVLALILDAAALFAVVWLVRSQSRLRRASEQAEQ